MKNTNIFVLYNILSKLAAQRMVVGYNFLLKEYKYQSKQEIGKSQLFKLLPKVGKLCLEKQEPLLNCLVVNKENLPGEGFYRWLRRNGLFPYHLKDRISQKSVFEFHKNECFNKCINAFKTDITCQKSIFVY